MIQERVPFLSSSFLEVVFKCRINYVGIIKNIFPLIICFY
jgi:hypothetical protein